MQISAANRLLITAADEVTYEAYASFIEHIGNPKKVEAFGLPSVLTRLYRSYKEMFEHLVKETGTGIDLVVQAFKQRDIFALLKAVGFNIGKLYKAVRAFTSLIPHGLRVIIEDLHEKGAFRHVEKSAQVVDQILDEHPLLRKLSGPAVAGLLICVWLHASATGDLKTDLDLSDALAALRGRFSIYDLFASPSGLHSLLLLGAGLSGIGGVAWLGSTIENLMLALFYTGARKLREHVDFQRVQHLMPKR